MSGTLLYDAIVSVFSFVLSIFFREVKSRGAYNIPKYGPVLFVAAPHHNQFVDPLILMKTARRRIGFLSAQKTMDRKDVGWLAKAVGAIGVTRAQDVAVKLPAPVRLADPVNVPDVLSLVGEGSSLQGLLDARKLGPGFSVLLTVKGPKNKSNDHSLEIEQIIDSRTIKLKRAVTDADLVAVLALEQGLAGKAAPKVDYNKV